jgi:hypothetical protein
MRTNKSKKTKVGTNMLDNGCKFEHFIAESGVKTPKIKSKIISNDFIINIGPFILQTALVVSS